MSDGSLVALITVGLPLLAAAVTAVWKWLTGRGLSRERSSQRVTVSDETVELWKANVRERDQTIAQRNQTIAERNQTIADQEQTIANLRRQLGRQVP